MPSIGPITVPDAIEIGTFPLRSDWPVGRAQGPEVKVHQMGPASANGKIEQRYVLGNGAKRFTFRRERLLPAEAAALASFWQLAQGPANQFTYSAPNEDGTFTDYTVRFAEQVLSFEYLISCICSVGLELVEIVTANPSYTVSATLNRFPSDALESALAQQVQVIVPLVKITPRGAAAGSGAGLGVFVPASLTGTWDVAFEDYYGVPDASGGNQYLYTDAACTLTLVDGTATLTWRTHTGTKFTNAIGWNGSWPITDSNHGPWTIPHTFSAGDEIVIECHSTGGGYPAGGYTWKTGPADRNPDGIIHSFVSTDLPTGDSPDNILLSDRRCIVDGDQYESRLLNLPQIDQSINGASDAVSFSFANADRVMTQLGNSVNLWRADLEFSLYHVGSQIKLDLWKGEVQRWRGRATDPVWTLEASDGFYELNLPYPRRKIGPLCWKQFDNAGNGCPFSAQGELQASRTLPLATAIPGSFPVQRESKTYTFTPDGATCDKSWDGKNGCLAHTMENYFGGIVPGGGKVITRDNSTGWHGIARASLTTAALTSDSMYGTAMPEIYCHITDADPAVGMPVACKLATGRDEGDFFAALGIVGEGPIGEYAVPNAETAVCPHKLDGQDPHGWSNEDHRNTWGLRAGNANGTGAYPGCMGADPVPTGEENNFSLSEGGAGITRWGPERAAGTAFVEIRRRDEKGLQLNTLQSHAMQVSIRQGLGGFKFATNGARIAPTYGMTNPIWIICNMILRAKGIQFAPAATQAAQFDLQALVDAANICDITVPKLIGPEGSEQQFRFQGVIGADGATKPLRDCIADVLSSCLGYYLFSFGKIKFGIRENSSAVEAYSDGNIIYGSLEYEPLSPTFNQLTVTFLDENYNFSANSVPFRDETHAKMLGGDATPQYISSEFAAVGVTSPSQDARIATTRVREEVGGFREETYLYGRRGKFRTTLLGLTSEPGQIIRIDHDDMPDYPATVAGSVDPQPGTPHMIEARIERWRLLPDYSVEIEWKSTHNEVYDLVVGPKPGDVGPAPVFDEEEFPPSDWRFSAYTKRDGLLRLNKIACGTNGDAVHQGFFDVYYVPEWAYRWSTTATNPGAEDTSMSIAGVPVKAGEWMLLGSEVVAVDSCEYLSGNQYAVTMRRGQLGTKAVAHPRISFSVLSVHADSPCKVTVQAGLELRPGMGLVLNDGSGPPYEIERIASYDPSTGVLYTIFPIQGVGVGSPLYADPAVYPVTVTRISVPFQPRFFRSAARSKWEHIIDLPNAGVVAIRGQLTNTRGKGSEIVTVLPVSPDSMDPQQADYESAWPHRIRTLDQERMQFSRRNLSSGSTQDIFVPFETSRPQPFESCYAEIMNGPGTAPMEPPPAVTSIVPTDLSSQAVITLSGTMDDSALISVQIVGTNGMIVPVWVGRDSGAASLGAAATSLAEWLNSDSHFAAYYSAQAAGSTVELTDLTGHGGAVQADTGGQITATSTGFDSALGVAIGRKYAVAYSGGGLRSALSPLSESTGITVSASRVEIRGVPRSLDARVTTVEIYATPDGAETPFYRVASVSNGTDYASDTTTEAALIAKTQYPGPSQPTQAGKVKVTLTRNGNDWAQLVIPANASRSNVVDGFALDSVDENTSINCDVDCDAPGVDLTVVLQ